MTQIVKVECLPVSTPLKKPVIMPNTRITSIDSVVLKLTTEDGTVGFSDSGDTSLGTAASCRNRSSR